MEETVTTAKAAEIVGIGYEGLRSYLKRGLLGSSGLMAPFVHPNSPAPDLSNVRSKWTRFGYVDLCLMRLAKQLIDHGLSFEQANCIVSADVVRSAFKRKNELPSTLVAWPPYYLSAIFVGEEHALIPAAKDIQGVAVLVRLDGIASSVRLALRDMVVAEGN